jgi:hypothetical protein
VVIEPLRNEGSVGPLPHSGKFRPDRNPDHACRALQAGGLSGAGIDAERYRPPASCEIRDAFGLPFNLRQQRFSASQAGTVTP